MNIYSNYHNHGKSQTFPKEKSLLNKSFSPKHSQIVKYTPLTQKVLYYILKFNGSKFIKLKNKTIADALGCSVRSVIYATNELQKDGVITKHQENRYAPNYYILNDSINENEYGFSHWFDSLSDHNQYLYREHGITVNTNNKIMFQFEYCTQSINSSLNNNLFINSCSSSSRIRHAREEFLKNKYPRKGKIMDNFENQFPNMAKSRKRKRNDQGHSPAVLKPVLSLEDQIIKLNNDIKSLSNKIELNKDPSYMISYAMNLVEHKIKELRELKVQYDNTTIYH